jgi:hypothetical protein
LGDLVGCDQIGDRNRLVTAWAQPGGAEPLTARRRACVASISLNAVAGPAALEPGPLVTLVRNRTVANVDSIGWVVLRWIQCSAGKSNKHSNASGMPVIFAAAFGRFTPNSLSNALIAVSTWGSVHASRISPRARRAAECTDFGNADSTFALACTQHRLLTGLGEHVT